ncbi:MAG: hypothetical protein V1712_03585 [Patescibacteria group bacterium]
MINLSSSTQPKQKILVSAIGIVAIVVGLLLLVIIPSINRIKDLSSQIFSQRIELEEIYLRGQSLKQTLTQYQQIKPTISVLNNAYILEGHELELITTLENLSEKNNIPLNIKLTSTIPVGKSVKILPLQLTLSSNFINSMNYLIGLENLDYYINITSIRMSANLNNPLENLNHNSNLTTLLLANAYYKP